MPREEIDLHVQVPHLSILDEVLAPEVSDDLLRAMDRAMLLAGRLDERMLALQRQGRIGTFAQVSGQEAAQIGADGTTSEGDFHEALNFAVVFATPTIFLCRNNQWAISVPREHQTRSRILAQKALAYGVSGIQVDGNDVLAATREAAARFLGQPTHLAPEPVANPALGDSAGRTEGEKPPPIPKK